MYTVIYLARRLRQVSARTEFMRMQQTEPKPNTNYSTQSNGTRFVCVVSEAGLKTWKEYFPGILPVSG